MKKISTLLVFGLVAILSGCSLTTADTVTTTLTETQNTEPVEVSTVAQLQAIGMTQDIELMNDLDLSGIEWSPLGSYLEPYSGTFNGNGHTISNMTITVSGSDYNGLFAIVTGSINDLTIADYSIDYTTSFVTYAGGLAGSSTANITNVNVSGEINIVNASSSSYVGLLVGVQSAYLTSEMTADEFIPNQVVNSNASGSLYVNSQFFSYVGGLIGKSYNSEILFNEVNATINVTSDLYRSYVGGLVGHHYGGILVGYETYVDTTEILIQGNVVFSDILVTSNGTSSSIGAFIGYSQYGQIYDNFASATIEASGAQLYIGSLIGEDWHSTVDKVVSVVDFNVIEEENQILLLSTFIGFNSDTTELSNAYYYAVSNTDFDQNLGDSITLQTLSEDTFYTSTLGWTNESIDLTYLLDGITVE
ncbi:MAG: lipoprotein [Candidatus Izemoplasmatales bacterium]